MQTLRLLVQAAYEHDGSKLSHSGLSLLVVSGGFRDFPHHVPPLGFMRVFHQPAIARLRVTVSSPKRFES